MASSIEIVLPPSSINPPAGFDHVATSWQISTLPDFDVNYYTLVNSLVDTINKLSWNGTLDTPATTVFYRYNLHYSDGSQSGWSAADDFAVPPSGDITNFIVIKTPDVKAKIDYTQNIAGELVLNTDPFVVFLGEETHASTSWLIYNQAGIQVYSSVIDPVNKYTLRVPLSIVEDNALFTVIVNYHGVKGTSSDGGKFVVSTYIVGGDYFQLVPYGDTVANRELFFSLLLKTSMFEAIDIYFKDDLGNVLYSDLGQATLAPSIFPNGAVPDNVYEVSAQLQLRNGTTTPLITIFKKPAKQNSIISIDNTATYLNKFSYIDSLTLNGLTNQVSVELYDGSFLLSRNSSNTIERFTLENDKIINHGTVITLPVTEHIGTTYLNIIPLYNGDIVLHYGAETDALNDQYSMFRYYTFNPITKEFTNTKELKLTDQWKSSAISNSAFTLKNNNIHYVPGAEYDSNGVEQPLSIYKLDTTDFTVSKLMDLPFVAYKHVSLCRVNDSDYLVLGGSEQPGTIEGKLYWHRDNNNIYKVQTDLSNNITQVGTIPNVLIPITVHNFHGILRKDGKVVLFNNVKNGDSLGDQHSYLITNPTESQLVIEKQDNDYSDAFAYRNSVVMQNGEILRISSKIYDPQVVYKYVSNTLTVSNIVENHTVTDTFDLIVLPGEVVNIDDLSLYESITVNGDETNSGIIQYQKDDYVVTFNYRDLIITRNKTLTYAELAAKNYSRITEVFGAELTVIK